MSPQIVLQDQKIGSMAVFQIMSGDVNSDIITDTAARTKQVRNTGASKLMVQLPCSYLIP